MFFASDLNDTQQIDSLLNDSKNRVYEKPDESIELGLSVFENFTYSTTTRTRALVLVSLGYTSKRDYQKALEYIIKANEISIELDDKKLQLEILFMTGIIYQQLKIFDKSIEYLEKIEKVAFAYPVYDSIGKYLANSYVVKGFIYKDNLNCDIALEFFDIGIGEYEKLKHINTNANTSIVFYNKGNCYILLSEYTKAKESFIKAIEFANLENASSLVSFAEKGMAEVYTFEGKYEDAILLLLSAFEQSKNVGDLVLNQGIYKGLFENYLALNNWDEYQKYYNLFLKTQLDIKMSERESISISIDKNFDAKKEKLNIIKNQYNNKLKWIFIIVILISTTVLIIERKNRKNRKTLESKIKTIQNLKPNP
jgi:tetratricopeptide (TPR) repeat protein